MRMRATFTLKLIAVKKRPSTRNHNWLSIVLVKERIVVAREALFETTDLMIAAGMRLPEALKLNLVHPYLRHSAVNGQRRRRAGDWRRCRLP
jgi:hypothetical protein